MLPVITKEKAFRVIEESGLCWSEDDLDIAWCIARLPEKINALDLIEIHTYELDNRLRAGDYHPRPFSIRLPFFTNRLSGI